MQSADVSVVIPAFNSERFISEALSSVLLQSIQPKQIMVVDDGSTDSTASVVKQFAGRVDLIQIPNSGVSHARNIGLDRATSTWVAFLDSDDTWEHKFLETFLKYASENPLAVLLFSDFRTFGQESNPQHLGEAFYRWRREHELLSPLVCVIPSASMVRKEVTTRYPEWARNNEDTIYFNDVADEGPVVHVPELLANYRKHASSAQKQFGSNERANKNLIRRYNSNPSERIRLANTFVAYAKQRRAMRSWSDFNEYCNLLESNWADNWKVLLRVRAIRLSAYAYKLKDLVDRLKT